MHADCDEEVVAKVGLPGPHARWACLRGFNEFTGGAMAKVEFGVRPFEGALGRSWYGWAQAGNTYKEGKVRWVKALAWLDGWRLARKIRGSHA